VSPFIPGADEIHQKINSEKQVQKKSGTGEGFFDPLQVDQAKQKPRKKQGKKQAVPMKKNMMVFEEIMNGPEKKIKAHDIGGKQRGLDMFTIKEQEDKIEQG
jgi:hypothetical protein